MTRIIGGFPGVGKSFLSKNRDDVIDLETLHYRWIYRDNIEDVSDEELKNGRFAKRPNPDFPENYINEVVRLYEEGSEDRVILTATAERIILRLLEKGYDVSLVYPKPELKEEYLERYINRGNSVAFRDNMDIRFHQTRKDTTQYDKYKNFSFYELEEGQYLSDIL